MEDVDEEPADPAAAAALIAVFCEADDGDEPDPSLISPPSLVARISTGRAGGRQANLKTNITNALVTCRDCGMQLCTMCGFQIGP